MAIERYRDPEENVDDRVKDLLARMSNAEKLAQLNAQTVASWLQAPEASPEASPEKRPETKEEGIGFLDLSSEDSIQSPLDAAALVNEVQHDLVSNTRLGIPALIHLGVNSSSDLAGFGGVRFPDGIGLAATFSPSAARSMAREIRDQLRAIGV